VFIDVATIAIRLSVKTNFTVTALAWMNNHGACIVSATAKPMIINTGASISEMRARC
jgi:hypothetical protein